jgi:hypothetical protein
MKTEEFNKCREFLENLLSTNKDDAKFEKLLAAYVKVMELKSIYDKDTDKAIIEKQIRDAELAAGYGSTVHSNETNLGIAHHSNWAAVQQNWQNNAAAVQQNHHNNVYATHQNYHNQAAGIVNTAISNIPYGKFP